MELINLDYNPFELIQNALWSELSSQGFKEPQELQDSDGQAVIFATDEVAYSLLYHNKRKSFLLRSTTLSEEQKPGDWRELSAWLFDNESSDRSDAESIINDFLDVVRGPKRVAMVQQQRKKAKNENRNVDPMFFINRLVHLFPDLKEPLNQEKITYGQVRYITFIKGNVLPLADDMLQKYPDSEPAGKLCALLVDMYENGDLDLRSIITYVFLNGLSKESFELVHAKLEGDLENVSTFSRKLIGKKIKPEKKKRNKGKKVAARLS